MTHDRVKSRIQTEYDSLERRLRGELVGLRVRVEREIKSLEKGERLDEHLIANATHMTADFARWNLVRDLIPILVELPVVDSRPITRTGKDRRAKDRRAKR